MGLVGTLFVPVMVRLLRKSRTQDVTSEWLENFSVASYYPMESLLNDEDFKFLSRQPGFDLSLYRKLRRDRLHIFKQYLNRAIVDFNRLHTTIRTLLPYAETDNSDVVSRLIWLRVRFSYAVLKAQLSYWLCVLGFRSLAVRQLILHLEEMSSQLNLVAAARAS
jgi:hypothetical protein